MSGHRKIGLRNDNQQRAAQARAQQQGFEPKPRRIRKMGATPDLFGHAGPTPEGRTPYDAPRTQAPAIAPLRMHPIVTLAVLANVALRGAEHALAPTLPSGTAPALPALPSGTAPARRLLQDSPAASTTDLLQQAARDLREAPCNAAASLADLSRDPAVNGTLVSSLSSPARAQVLEAAGLSTIAPQSWTASSRYYSNGWGGGANPLAAPIRDGIDAVNAAQLAFACATPATVEEARTNLTQAWKTLHNVERTFWDSTRASWEIGHQLNTSELYTTEGNMPNATAMAALQPVPAGFNLSGASFAGVLQAADTLKLFDLSRDATHWAQASLNLLNHSSAQSVITPAGVSRVMAPLLQQLDGSLGGVLRSLQVDDTTYNLYSQLDSNLLPALTRAYAATATLVGDSSHVESLWNHANLTGASASTQQHMRAARAAWQSARALELSQIAKLSQPPRNYEPWYMQQAGGPATLSALTVAAHDPASVAQGAVPLLRGDLLPEVINSAASAQDTITSIRDAASLNASRWRAVTDLATEQPALQDALLFTLGNLDAQATASSQGPQQHLMMATTLAEPPARELFAALTAPADSPTLFGEGWQKLLVQRDLGQDVAGQKLRWSEWANLAAEMHVNPPEQEHGPAFKAAMQSVGLPLRDRNSLAYGAQAALATTDGTAVTYPALSALNDVKVPNAWREATVNQLMSPWASTGAKTRATPYGYFRLGGAPMSDTSSQALATLLGLRLQTGQGDAYPIAYEALVGKPPSALRQAPQPPVVGVDDLLNSLWPEAKARVRYDAKTQTWQSKPISASWDSGQVRSAATLNGLTLTSRTTQGKQRTQNMAGWVKDAVTLRCASFDTCSDDTFKF